MSSQTNTIQAVHFEIQVCNKAEVARMLFCMRQETTQIPLYTTKNDAIADYSSMNTK